MINFTEREKMSMIILMIIGLILMGIGGVCAVNGYVSMVAIHLSTKDGLMETGIIILVIGLGLFVLSLIKYIKDNKQ